MILLPDLLILRWRHGIFLLVSLLKIFSNKSKIVSKGACEIQYLVSVQANCNQLSTSALFV